MRGMRIPVDGPDARLHGGRHRGRLGRRPHDEREKGLLRIGKRTIRPLDVGQERLRGGFLVSVPRVTYDPDHVSYRFCRQPTLWSVDCLHNPRHGARFPGRATIPGMLNYIWFGLMAVARSRRCVQRARRRRSPRAPWTRRTTAVQIAIGLVGIMTLWLGMMRVAEAAGLVSLVGRALSPLLRWLFPDVPPAHPAAGAIVLALAANMLGLNNAATPLGIKAMEELQTLNPDKETATNSMVTLMAVTTSGVQLIPATMIGVLAAAGSTNPTAIIAPTIRRDVHRYGGRGRRRQAAAALLSAAGGSRRGSSRDPRCARRCLAVGHPGAAGRRSRSSA